MNTPLNEQHLDSLNRVIQSATQHLETVKMCRECDIPMDDAEQALRTQLAVASKIKAKHFPNAG